MNLLDKITLLHLKCKYDDIFNVSFLDLIKKNATSLLTTRCDFREYQIRIVNPNSKLKDNGLVYQRCGVFDMMYHHKILEFQPSIDILKDILKNDMGNSEKKKDDSSNALISSTNKPEQNKNVHDDKDFYHDCIIILFSKKVYYANTILSKNIERLIQITGIEII